MEPLKHGPHLQTPMSRDPGEFVLDAPENRSGAGIEEFLAVLRRHKTALLLPIVLLCAASIGLAWGLPPLYRSTATILIEQQEVPEELVRSTVSSYADERIQTITQRVLTIANLQEIIEKFDLYPELRNQEPIDVVADRVREHFEVERVSAARGRSLATIAFNISFDARSPIVAQAVATELSSLYLEANLKTRTESAADTTAFLSAEAERLAGEIGELEARIAEFKEAHMGRLPEQLDLNLDLMARAEQQIQEIGRQTRSLEDRKIYLRTAMNQLEASARGETSELAEQLKAMQARLRGMLAIFTPQHPDVKRLQTEIESLEKQAANQSGPAGLRQGLDEREVGPDYADLQVQYRTAEREVAALRSERGALQAKVAEYEQRIDQIPQIERQFSLLVRDRDNLLTKYQEIRAKLSSARVAENLEKARKGERFSLIEPARRPSKPFKPNRKKILTLGLMGSIGAGIGAAIISGHLHKAVYGVRGVTALLGAPPLAIIPFVKSPADRRRRAARRALLALVVLAALGAAVALIHFYVMPLEDLQLMLLARLDALWAQMTSQLEAAWALVRGR